MDLSKVLIVLENAIWIKEQAELHGNSEDPHLLEEIKRRLEFEISEIDKILKE